MNVASRGITFCLDGVPYDLSQDETVAKVREMNRDIEGRQLKVRDRNVAFGKMLVDIHECVKHSRGAWKGIIKESGVHMHTVWARIKVALEVAKFDGTVDAEKLRKSAALLFEKTGKQVAPQDLTTRQLEFAHGVRSVPKRKPDIVLAAAKEMPCVHKQNPNTSLASANEDQCVYKPAPYEDEVGGDDVPMDDPMDDPEEEGLDEITAEDIAEFEAYEAQEAQEAGLGGGGDGDGDGDDEADDAGDDVEVQRPSTALAKAGVSGGLVGGLVGGRAGGRDGGRDMVGQLTMDESWEALDAWRHQMETWMAVSPECASDLVHMLTGPCSALIAPVLKHHGVVGNKFVSSR